MSDPFGNKCGGRGVCPHCHVPQNNVAYHRVHECPQRPEAIEDRYLESLDANPIKEVKAQTFDQFLKEIRESQEMKAFVKHMVNPQKEPTLNEVFEEFFTEPTDPHQCRFDSDGGPCRICGKTASETLFNVLSGKPTPKTPEEPKGLFLYCSSCEKLLTQPGALLFSPPYKTQDITEKYHLCLECYELTCDVLGIDFNFPSGGHD